MPPSSSVISDDQACGKLAAQYFIDRGFQNFAYVGGRDTSFSEDRASGYLEHLRKAGFEAETFDSPLGREKELAIWLQKLPRPLALFGSSDRRAVSALEACYLSELKSPEEIAVLGIGNYPQLCELTTPTLSSVDTDMENRGFEAAALLFRLISGDPAPSHPIHIPPAGIVYPSLHRHLRLR